MPLSDCGAISSSWLSFLSSDILACYERSFHLSRCLKEWGQLTCRHFLLPTRCDANLRLK
jgi:hypothetical protein